MSPLTGREIAAAGLPDWAYLRDGLQTRLLLPSYAVGLRLVTDIGAAAEAADHHPDLDLRHGHLDVRLTSHDVRRVTRRDLALARTISDLVAAAGVVAEPAETTTWELALDTPDSEAVLPFWRAVLDLPERRLPGQSAELADDVRPTVWFQASGDAEPRQRFHLDVWVVPEVVEERIAAAVAAGGTLVSDAEAPAFWVLADPDGNRICLCTWQERDG